MDNYSPRDLFAPIWTNEAVLGPILLIARLFTTGIFVFYISKEIANIHPLGALLYVAIAAQIIGIAMVALGYKTRFASLLLAVCIVATLLLFRGSLGFHNSLVTISEKIVCITGLFLFMFANGPGPLSLDRYLGEDKPSGIADNEAVMGPLLLAGRLLSIIVFVFFGISKILNTPEIKAYMVRHNPHVPTNLVYLAILTQIVPPILVLLGYKTRYGAVALGGFCIVAPSLFHNAFGNPSEVEHFLLDFAIAGGFAFMFAYGPGPLSMDARMGRTKSTAAAKEALSVGA
jgi:putative oxidoreductase